MHRILYSKLKPITVLKIINKCLFYSSTKKVTCHIKQFSLYAIRHFYTTRFFEQNTTFHTFISHQTHIFYLTAGVSVKAQEIYGLKYNWKL